LHALADRTRVLIVSAVLHAPPNGEPHGRELQEQLDLRQPTSSHHLRTLVRSGIVEREQRGPYAYYRVAPDALSRLRAIFGGRPPRVPGGDGAHPGRWRGRHNEPEGIQAVGMPSTTCP
jgi:ArsR family transcriptional regulator, arsenate/arsenite/antimonite-responsive transcriptional repressor